MSESIDHPSALEGVTSLYRRFRPGRFAELRGQDHVVRALQGAVKNDRVSHAYLFSGPRGTGKTTTARILAKALNCESPSDGDACDVCASCVAITRGSSLDVVELDAASNNGVDDIRDITSGAWHNTPGRWRIYIFDEVHQLSKAASAALLKTLEEPPAHVVFVLATTDPHKVLPTIRSRTQHLEFRLISGETLSGLLHDIERAAGLAADEELIEAAVRLGRGSARDALSALDQLIATGTLNESRPSFDDLLAALVDSDAVALLGALAQLMVQGWDPEQLAESLVGELRQIFLLLVAPDAADAVDADRERLSTWGERLGLARCVRVIEILGRTLREMRGASDKVVTLEVALVRVVRPDLDATYEALDERLTRLERAPRAVAPVEPSSPAPPARPIGQRPRAVSPGPESSPPPVVAASQGAPSDEPSKVETVAADETVTRSSDSESPGSFEEVRERFVNHVIPRTSRAAQLILRSSRVESFAGSLLTLALPSEELRGNTDKIAQGLRGALEHEFRVPIQVAWVVDPSMSTSAGAPSPTTPRTPPRALEPDADEFDDDHASVVVESAAEHLITEMFPGAEEIE